MEPLTSVAYAFFSTHKALFEYDKHVGSQDPFQPQVRGDSTAKDTASFLERYRECDRNRPPAKEQTEVSFSLLHPRASAQPMAALMVDVADMTPQPKPTFVSVQSTVPSPLRSSHLANSLPASIPPSPHRVVPHGPQPSHFQSTTSTVKHDSTPLRQYPSPQHVSTVERVGGGFDTRLSAASVLKHETFCMPKLTDLLVHRDTRATALSPKTWDEAHKIEILVGDKCVGRVSAASRNLPPSIQLRLQASANVVERREQLYNLLRGDYEQLSQRYAQ